MKVKKKGQKYLEQKKESKSFLKQHVKWRKESPQCSSTVNKGDSTYYQTEGSSDKLKYRRNYVMNG